MSNTFASSPKTDVPDNIGVDRVGDGNINTSVTQPKTRIKSWGRMKIEGRWYRPVAMALDDTVCIVRQVKIGNIWKDQCFRLESDQED
jgi:hypothetical protein